LSINLRNNNIPVNLILLSKSTLSIDSNYTHETSLFDKRLKQVPDSCTNPGTSVGAAIHDHGCSGSHTHTICPSTWNHCHVYSTDVEFGGGVPPFGPQSAGAHFHNFGGSSECIALTICSAGCHTHGSKCSNIASSTVRTIKKTNSIVKMREGGIPKCTLLMWEDPLACIPCDYTRFTCLDDEYLKGVPDSCTAPLNADSGGSHTHCSINHSHTITQAAHCSHTVNGTSGGPSATIGQFGSGQNVASATHTHTVSGTSTSISGICGNVCSGGHTHTCSSLQLSRLSVIYLSKSTIDIRRKNIPLNSINIWNSPLACIPSGHLLMDGTSGTTNILDRYVKGAVACAAPGGTTGSNEHQHCSENHAHCCESISHSHTTGAQTTANGVGQILRDNSGFGGTDVATVHSHVLLNPSLNATRCASLSCVSHIHCNIDHKPPTVEVAFIKRI